MNIGVLTRARLVAGAAGLDREVSFVDVLEVPDAAGWFRPHLLVLTTGYAVRDDAKAQLRLVEGLGRAGAAGPGNESRALPHSHPRGNAGGCG